MDVRAHNHFYDHFATLEIGVHSKLCFDVPPATPGGATVIPTVGGSAETDSASDADNDAPVVPDGDAANAAEIIGENPVKPTNDAPKGEAELNTDVQHTGDNFAEASDSSDATEHGLNSDDAATEQQASNDAARTYDTGADHVDALGDQQADLWNQLNTQIDNVQGRNNEYNGDGEADGNGDIVFGGNGLFTQTERTELINEIIKDPARLQQILDQESVGAEDRAALQRIHDLARSYQTSETGEISTTQTLDDLESRLNASGHTQALDGVRLTDRTEPDNAVNTNAERIASINSQVDSGALAPGLKVSETGNIVATVEPGDSYWAMKERYGMSQEEYQAFRVLNQPRMTNYEGGNASTTSYFAMLQTGDQLLLPPEVQNRIYNGGVQRDVVNAASYQFNMTGAAPAPAEPTVPQSVPGAPQVPTNSTQLSNALSNLWTGGEGDFGQLTAALDGESGFGTDHLREFEGASVQQRVAAQITADIGRGMTPQQAIIAFADSVHGIDETTRTTLKMNLAEAYGVRFA